MVREGAGEEEQIERRDVVECCNDVVSGGNDYC